MVSESLTVFKNLEIIGKNELLDSFLNQLNEILSNDGWIRDKEAETRLGREFFAIKANTQQHKLESMLLLLIDRKKSILKITNILPSNKSSLTYEEYNEILTSFYDECIKPLINNYPDFKIHFTDGKENIDSYLSSENSALLQLFLASANMSTGSSHPSDRKTWNNFLINLVKTNEDLPSDFLERWLIEIEGWPYDIVSDLISEFDFGICLLKQYKMVGSE